MYKKILTITLVTIFGFINPTTTRAADCWVVTGAGSTVVNGEYFLAGDSSDYDNGGTTGLAGTDAWALDSLSTGYVLAVTDDGAGTYNATELRGISSGLFNGTGYYYGVISPPYDTYSGINTTNANGSNPVPTIVFDNCGGTTPTSTPTTTIQYVDSPTQDLCYGYILFLAGFVIIIWVMRGRKTH